MRRCTMDLPKCELQRESEEAIARHRYRQFELSLRTSQQDPRFEAVANQHDENGIDSFSVKAQSALTQPCRLAEQDCVRAKVFLLADLDQAVRLRPACKDPECEQRKSLRMRKVDSASTEFAQEVLHRFGWLGTAAWGRATEDGLFLLVQHADQNPGLQREALALLKAAVAKGKGSVVHAAYLEDRVKMHAGEPQVYGTQGQCVRRGGAAFWEPIPIGNPLEVDARRLQVGLGPLSDYAQKVTPFCR